jgi:hypothetical protein
MVAAVAAAELLSEFFQPFATGPMAQADISTWSGLSAAGAPGATIAGGGNYTSLPIACPGWKNIAVGCRLSQTGTITIQRYLDKAGQVPVGAPITASLVANTSNWATVNDGLPFQSFTFIIANTSGSLGNLDRFAAVVQAN